MLRERLSSDASGARLIKQRLPFSDTLTGQALAQHVELIERRIAQRQRAARALPMSNVDFNAQYIRKMLFKRRDIGVFTDRSRRGPASRRRAFPLFRPAHQVFGIAHRQALGLHCLC